MTAYGSEETKETKGTVYGSSCRERGDQGDSLRFLLSRKKLR